MKSVTVENLKCFNLARTLLCGQCFRFEEIENGKFEIIAKCKKIVASQKGDCLILEGIDREEYESYFRDYFDIDRDYETLDKLLCTDKTLRLASPYSKGIHILKQEPFETLCSFIISQNNNIPRIKGIISRLCELLGDEIEAGVYSFPTAEKLAVCTVDDLAPIRSGFRAKYLIDAAQKVSSGEVSLAIDNSVPLDEAREHLKQIKGVGNKVADCVLLFAYARFDSFPQDVWIKRIMEENYPDGLPKQFERVAGIAQQYLFHYFRNES